MSKPFPNFALLHFYQISKFDPPVRKNAFFQAFKLKIGATSSYLDLTHQIFLFL